MEWNKYVGETIPQPTWLRRATKMITYKIMLVYIGQIDLTWKPHWDTKCQMRLTKVEEFSLTSNNASAR